MFRRSRRKIVASIMGALILLFSVTLAVIVLSEYRKDRLQSEDMLDHYVMLYSPERLPGSEGAGLMPPGQAPGEHGPMPPGQGPEEEPMFRLSAFYSVSFYENGDVLAVDTGQSGLYSAETLTGIAEDVLKTGKLKGKIGSLTYQVARREGYTLAAFIDDTVINESIASLVRHTLAAGGAALAILFLAAFPLAGWIVRPLEENDRKQKQFISDAGHELKTPVSVISANAELLSRETDPSEWLDNIRYENDRMGDLVTQLLELSRAENAQPDPEQLDLSRLVTGEVLPFESVAFERGMTIKSDIAEGIMIEGNRPRLSQLVSILLDNAVRHSGGGEIVLALREQGKNAVLTVENSGGEIPPDKLERLFERFYRVDGSRNSEGGHYGLGLAIARAVAEAHGGCISAASGDGKVVFTVSLPLKGCKK